MYFPKKMYEKKVILKYIYIKSFIDVEASLIPQPLIKQVGPVTCHHVFLSFLLEHLTIYLYMYVSK